MAKLLVVDYEKCVGCRTCEMACSLVHERMVNPSRSRIQVVKWTLEGTGMPIVCQQCNPAPCIDGCPTNARYRSEETGIVATDHERCIRCRTCMTVCPFGAIGFDPVANRVFSCDLCDGIPQCVEFCGYDALHYVEEEDIHREQARKAAQKLYESQMRFAEAGRS